MRQNHEMVTEVDGDEEILLKKPGVLFLLGNAAFRGFEKTARKRSRAALNLIFTKAKEKGYPDKERFVSVFKTSPGRSEDGLAASEKLGGYISFEDVVAAINYVRGVS